MQNMTIEQRNQLVLVLGALSIAVSCMPYMNFVLVPILAVLTWVFGYLLIQEVEGTDHDVTLAKVGMGLALVPVIMLLMGMLFVAAMFVVIIIFYVFFFALYCCFAFLAIAMGVANP